MNHNLILDFNHTYDPSDPHIQDFTYFDLSHLEGCDMYCSKKTKTYLENIIQPYPQSGLHFIDNGNYHYLSALFVEKIKEPFNLFVFDHHTDMQDGLIDGLLSCGNWVQYVLENNPCLNKLILIGPQRKAFKALHKHSDKLISISFEDIKAQRFNDALKTLAELPAYVSVDKDVLSKAYAYTNWDQGDLSMNELEHLLSIIFVETEIIGIDICGACDMHQDFPIVLNESRLNKKMDDQLIDFIHLIMNFKKVEKIR